MLKILFSLLLAYSPGMLVIPDKGSETGCNLGGQISFDGKKLMNISVLLIHTKRNIRVETETDKSGQFCANFNVHLNEEYELYIYYPYTANKSFFYRLRLKHNKNKFDRNHQNVLYKD